MKKSKVAETIFETQIEITNEDEKLSINKEKSSTKMTRTNVFQLAVNCINNIINVFVGTFLVSYIYSISSNYLVSIGLFYLFLYISMAIFYIGISFIIDKTNRVIFFRIALVIRAGFIFLVIFAGKELAGLVILAGAIYGFSEACYWTSYNLMKNELVQNSVIKKYSSFQQILDKLVSIIVPITLGTIIDKDSFKTSAIIVAVIVLVQVVLSFFIKSERPKDSSFDLKGFFKDIKALGEEKKSVTNCLGIAYIYGLTSAISPTQTILIMLVFSSNMSLGIVSSITAAVAIIFMIILTRHLKIGKNGIFYFVCGILPLLATIIFSAYISKTTMIIFALFYSVLHLSYVYSFDVTRNVVMKNLNMFDSIAEFQACVESGLQLGRITIFLIMTLCGVVGGIYGTSGLIVASKIFLSFSVAMVLVINILLARYEKRLKEHNLI